ncbi:MAG: hypothetical protein ACI865_001276 [Flavobacteriaceae bacterium]|jgi:hypothetical protein
MIKNLLLFSFTSLLILSCGPSEEEQEQSAFDATVNAVCECAKANESDFLGMDGCYQMANAALEQYKDNDTRLAEMKKSFSECLPSE